MDLPASGEKSVVNCEHNNDHLGYIKGDRFLDQLS